MKNLSRRTGIIIVIIAAIFWGVGGTVAQKLFNQYGIAVNWLVTIRLLVAGLLLLAIQYWGKNRSQVFGVWKNPQIVAKLFIFGIFGMLAVQYTYMASINHGNAAVATLLQYLAPVMIIIYLVFRGQSPLTGKDILIVTLALGGCFFLVTNGSISSFSVPPLAVIWGFASGLAYAFYTLYAVSLLKEYDSLVIVGWAMVIGGTALSFIHPPWQIDLKTLTVEAYLYLVFVIIFGTMIAFWFYFESLNSLSPKETSLFSCLEPLAAVLTTVFWLKVPFGSFQWLGAACMMVMILMLALSKESSPQKLT